MFKNGRSRFVRGMDVRQRVGVNLRRYRTERGFSANWHLDEMFVKIRGRQLYLWRAVDAEGEVLDFLVHVTGLPHSN